MRNLGTALPVAGGGTGGTSATAGRQNLGAAASGANTDITSLASPALGAPTMTTQGSGDNSTRGATTAYVDRAVGAASTAASNAQATANAATPTSGAVVNSARVQSSALASTSTQVTFSDSPPTSGNTTAITALSVSITPKSSANKLRVRAVVQCSLHGLGGIVAALFQNGGSTAVACNYATCSGTDYNNVIEVTYETTAGSTGQQTFNIGVGGNNGYTTTVNGSAQTRYFGGTAYSSIEVLEVLS